MNLSRVARIYQEQSEPIKSKENLSRAERTYQGQSEPINGKENLSRAEWTYQGQSEPIKGRVNPYWGADNKRNLLNKNRPQHDSINHLQGRGSRIEAALHSPRPGMICVQYCFADSHGETNERQYRACQGLSKRYHAIFNWNKNWNFPLQVSQPHEKCMSQLFEKCMSQLFEKCWVSYLRNAWVSYLRNAWVSHLRNAWVSYLRNAWVSYMRNAWVSHNHEKCMNTPRDSSSKWSIKWSVQMLPGRLVTEKYKRPCVLNTVEKYNNPVKWGNGRLLFGV